MPKIPYGPQYSRGKDGPKQGMIRNHCAAMESTTLKSEDGIEKPKANDRAAIRAKEFKMPKIPKLLTANKASNDGEQPENRDSTVEGREKRKKVICLCHRV